MTKGTVTLHRVLKASPEKVFRAFSNPDAMTFWMPPYGFLCQVHEYDFRVGGRFRMSFVNFSTGNGHSFGGQILELVPNEKLVQTDIFEDTSLPGEMKTTVILRQVICGTSIEITQEGIPEQIPVEMCYLGWQESLEKLAHLVEPVIPDGA